jgi:uncharacterized protein YkwD
MLDPMSLRAVVIAAVVAILTALTPMAHATEPLVEDRVIALINAQRTDRLTVHYGLLAAARGHSQRMAREGGLSHEGADERVNSAPPDPGEFNGAPDDGFGVAAWCENVTYTVGTSQDEAPQRIFDQWNRGGAHHRCMMDTSRNVGAVGVYYDGQSWWATFIAEVDSTPPGGAAPTAKPRPAAPADAQKTAKPQASSAPSDDDTSSAPAPEPTSGAIVVEATPVATEAATRPEVAEQPVATDAGADERSTPDGSPNVDPVARPNVRAIAQNAAVPIAPRPGIGWPELAAVAAVLSIATVLLRRSLVGMQPATGATIVDDVDVPALTR